MSIARQNWSLECEQELNEQIGLEFYAGFYYKLLSCWFGSDKIAYDKLSIYFENESEEEFKHANRLIRYQVKRGGTYSFDGISKIHIPSDSVLECFKKVLNLERKVNTSLLKLHKTAEGANDPHFMGVIEGEFLNEQIDANMELAQIITTLENIGDNKALLWQYINQKFV